MLRKRYSNRSKRSVIGTPPPVKGRRHETIQTERYLEELPIKPSDYSVECQTDLYLYEIPDAPYVSTKTGIDVATETDADGMFDFDEEVQPIVDALIELTMKQALSEFMQEEEMRALQKSTEQYIANKEHFESKRLEMDEENQLKSTDEVNAAKLLHSYILALLSDILNANDAEISKLHQLDNDEQFKPWLANEIASEVGQMIDSKDSLQQLVKNIVETRAETYFKNENQ